MPVSEKTSDSSVVFNTQFLLTAIILLILQLPAAMAGFSTRQMDASLNNEALEVTGQLELDLSRKTEEALGKGIPLEVIFELQLNRQRLLMWDERLGSWQFKRKIIFHAMSNQYLISSTMPGAEPSQESFASLQDALAAMGNIENMELKLSNAESVISIIHSTSDPLQLEIRARLDIESLPSPLRPVAYTSRSWRLNSGWSSWPVKY